MRVGTVEPLKHSKMVGFHPRKEKKGVKVEDPTTGELQTEFLLPKLQPGQIVAAVARPFNGIGGARLWSPMPGDVLGRKRHRPISHIYACVPATGYPTLPQTISGLGAPSW